MKLRPVARDFSGDRVDREAPDDNGSGIARCHRHRLGTTDLCLGPRGQLEDAERFGDVVVSTGIQKIHFLMLGMPSREDDDRHCGPLTNLAADVHAGHVRQAEVEHYEVRSVVRRGVDAGAPAGSFVYTGSDITKRVAHSAANLWLVVNDKHEI